MSISSTSGVVSSIDYGTLINQLVSLKRISIDQLQTRKEGLQNADTAYSALKTKVSDLKTAADALRTASGFKVFTTSITDETILGATADSTASPGTYKITVSQLAKAHKLVGTGLSSSTASVHTGTDGFFKFTVGAGAEQSIAITSTTTLDSLRTAINDLGAGVTASIVNDGSGANAYRLILTSDTTGSSNGITVTMNNTNIASFSSLQAAQDAQFTVDNLSLTRSTNTASDVITGVTLDFKSADPLTEVTLAVTRDTGEIEKKVASLIDKYNAVVSHIKANNRYDSDTKTAGAFFGDAVARSVWEDLRTVMSSSVTGLPSTMNRLIHAGVTSDTDGKYSIDSSDFSAALGSDFDAVVDLFIDQTSTVGFAGLIYDKANDISDFADGRITLRQGGINDSIDSITRTIDTKEDELTRYEDQLRAQFTALETLLASIKHQNNYLQSIF